MRAEGRAVAYHVLQEVPQGLPHLLCAAPHEGMSASLRLVNLWASLRRCGAPQAPSMNPICGKMHAPAVPWLFFAGEPLNLRGVHTLGCLSERLQAPFKGPFLCPDHVECYSCGARVPGSGTSSR